MTPAPGGMPQLVHGAHNADKEFYLVNDGDKQYLVMVTDEFMESRQLAQKITDKKFCIGEFQFTVGCLLP